MQISKWNILFLLVSFLNASFPSYYYKIKNVKKQKEAFVNILLPLINKENENIINLREKIIKIFNDPNLLLNFQEMAFLKRVAKKYKIKNSFNKIEFLKKIDEIPPSLALAQAAIESAWGKSRFTREANNLFGHWDYSNRGLQPKSKYENIDINYSIKIFPSIESSLSAYMLNLNRNPAYQDFRNLRYQYRMKKMKFTGIAAAATLQNYSQLGAEYSNRLIRLIKYNHWEKLDFLNKKW